MIELFVKRPAMTLMLVLVFVVLGGVSYFNLVVERSPKVEFPLVSIKTVYPGASPAEIESQIVKKIEDAVSEISQIDKINSFCYDSLGFTMVEFEIGSDVNIKAIEIKDKVEPIINDLPKGALKPEIAKFDPMIEPIIDLVLVSRKLDERELFEYADKKLKTILGTTEGVASVDIYGGKQRQINIKLDPVMMKKHFVSIAAVLDSIREFNTNVPGGSVDRPKSRLSVRMTGEFESVEDIKAMRIVSQEGASLRLADIANVEDAYRKISSITRYNGGNVVGLSVKKLSDGDAVTIVKKIKKTIQGIEKNLPEGINIEIAYDSTKNIITETNATVVNILLGIFFTVVILLLFLGDPKVTVIAGIVIPSSIISALFLMDFSGFTINFMTLLAIATALGTLIANALIVIDSVYLHIESGKAPVQAAIDGTREAAIAVLASAGTNLVVFTPIAFMGGIIGQFMKQFGLTVVYTTIFSILASFSLTPMMCALMLGKKDARRAAGGIFKTLLSYPSKLVDFLLYEYGKLFAIIIKNPKTVIGISLLALIAGSAYMLRYIGNEFFTNSDVDKIAVGVKMPTGARLNVTLDAVKRLESMISEIPEVTSYLSYVGIDGEENASLTVNLSASAGRKRSDADIIDSLIPRAAGIPDAEISFVRGDGGAGFADITVNVYGDDYDKLIVLSERMKTAMKNSGYFRSVESSYRLPNMELKFVPDAAKMVRFGVTNQGLGSAMRDSITGNDDNVYKEKGEEYRINVELDDRYKRDIDDIKNIALRSTEGLVAIAQLGDVVLKRGNPTILRRDKKRMIQLGGYLAKSSAGQVMAALDERFKNLEFPENYTYAYAGNAEFQNESNAEILKAFLLAVVLTYMLLVAVMNSFFHPFTIATTVFSSLLGVFGVLFFMELTINVGSMITMVMLVGLVVNNAILMIDYAMQKMSAGIDPTGALWEGARVKFRAILMTSIAIIAGVLPQLFDKDVIKASMGGVIIGGMIGSIIFTFVMIPAVFLYVERFSRWLKSLKKSE